MSRDRLVTAVTDATATAFVVFVATSVVFATPTEPEPSVIAVGSWVLFVGVCRAWNVDTRTLSTFAVVFAGSLVGLSVLFSGLGGDRMLDDAFADIAPGGGELLVNPVVLVLVAGALALAYYGVFERRARPSRETRR